jgi:hypothetical protein
MNWLEIIQLVRTIRRLLKYAFKRVKPSKFQTHSLNCEHNRRHKEIHSNGCGS